METITLNGTTYAPIQQLDERVIVRSTNAGVFFGSIAERDGDHITLANARRIWYWAGAASLSELATSGTSKPSGCKFPATVASVELFGVCEILPVTEQAATSIDAVKVWTA